MQKQVSALSRKILQDMKEISQVERLNNLIEILESTIDPDPSEIYLLDSLYQLREKLLLTESRISSYIGKNKNITTSNKLEKLYDNVRPIGSSILFD